MLFGRSRSDFGALDTGGRIDVGDADLNVFDHAVDFAEPVRRTWGVDDDVIAGAARKITASEWAPQIEWIAPTFGAGQKCPIEHEIMKDGAIVSIGEVGGLHHRYERVAA